MSARTAVLRRGLSLSRSADPRVVGLYVFLALFLIAVSFKSVDFRTMANLEAIVSDSALLSLVTIGQFLVILTGGIDLSVGSIAKLSGLLTASLMAGSDSNIVVALGLAVLVGLGVGAINATVVNRLGVAPFIATFATFYIIRGAAYHYSTSPIGKASPSLYALYTTTIAGLPVVFLFVLALWGGLWTYMRHSISGRHILAVGGDAEAARLAGIKVRRVRLTVYLASAVLAALAGFLNLSRIGVGDPNAGDGLELQSITAIVLGGVTLLGGRGSVAGAFAGVLLISAISNAMDLLQVNALYQGLIQGFIIIAAVSIYRSNKSSRDTSR